MRKIFCNNTFLKKSSEYHRIFNYIIITIIYKYIYIYLFILFNRLTNELYRLT